MTSFEIHAHLQNDCHRLGRFDRSHLLLHRNALFHWFILVPETDVLDILDLDDQTRNAVISECALVSRLLKVRYGYPKVNFAGIGNVVPQLHLHVIGRRPDDPLWPNPVWGHLKHAIDYTPSALTDLRDRLIQDCALEPCP